MTHSIHRIFSSRAGFHMNPNGGGKTGAGVSNVTCSVPRAPGPWLLHDSATSSGREGWGRGRRPTASPPMGPSPPANAGGRQGMLAGGLQRRPPRRLQGAPPHAGTWFQHGSVGSPSTTTELTPQGWRHSDRLWPAHGTRRARPWGVQSHHTRPKLSGGPQTSPL